MDSSVTNTGGLMPSATISNSEGATMLLNDIPDPTQNVFLSRNVTDNLFEVQDQNLIESLSREVLLGTGTWQSGQAEISTTLTEQQLITNYEQPSIRQISLPDDIVKGSSFIASKLANIAYMRCDYELYLRVQGSPFLQGLLLLWNKMNADQTSKIRSSITEHLRSITSFPGVTLNMQSDSRSVKLVIPYTSEFQVFNPRNENKLNSVRLSILSALRGPSTSEKATYSIMGRMTNIKLYGHAPSIVSLSYPQTE
nr:Chain B, VP2 of Mud crab dicistrovirus [Mud crab virus]